MIKKGFTLIELLVVIGIMAVLAAGVVALINPLEKTRQANDANIQNAVGQVATALQSYAAQQTNGNYPTVAQGGLSQLTLTGELVALPVLPAGSSLNYLGGGVSAGVYVPLTSAKYLHAGTCNGTAYWYWTSTNGKACGSCNVPTVTSNNCDF